MTAYLLAYDLRNERNNNGYHRLYKELERFEACRAQDSLWFVDIPGLSAAQVEAHFKSYMDKDDLIWVSEIVANHAGFITNAGVDWLKKHHIRG